MTGFRFLHSSDLHLGRPFAAIPDEAGIGLRGRLIEARHGALSRLAQAARDQGAAHILLAGDTFDSTTPRAAVRIQALAAMADDPALTWWILPGNHDNLAEAEPLWDALAGASDNVRCLRDAVPVVLSPEATLLPAPVTHRSSGRDLSQALDTMPTGAGVLRLGLAHGGVAAFDGAGSAEIAPDRDRQAGLDYLALGDWHGRKAISARTHYSGTPEQDRFKHDRRGVALAVTLPGPGAAPEITEVETGQFLWRDAQLDLLPGRDPADALAALTPTRGLRETLLRVTATGRTTLAGHHRLVRALGDIAPALAHVTWRAPDLRIEADPTDLEVIDGAGPLRVAADRLAEAAQDPSLSERDTQIAQAALARLFALAQDTTA